MDALYVVQRSYLIRIGAISARKFWGGEYEKDISDIVSFSNPD